jgi:hypothetical protein
LRVARGEQGVDVSVPKPQHCKRRVRACGNQAAVGIRREKMRQQILEWEYDPSTVQAITYDANGNVYFGFR